MAKPKFDYDGNAFYDEIERLAAQGSSESEISYLLADKFGVDLNPGVFSQMKNGDYVNWTKEQNEVRSALINKHLERGRSKINYLVRGRYLKAALGGVIVKGTSKTKRHIIVDGQDTGNYIVDERTTEQETPPNIQALSVWLYHFDPEWKKVQRGKDDDDNLPFDPKKGISIQKWIEREIEDDQDADPEGGDGE